MSVRCDTRNSGMHPVCLVRPLISLPAITSLHQRSTSSGTDASEPLSSQIVQKNLHFETPSGASTEMAECRQEINADRPVWPHTLGCSSIEDLFTDGAEVEKKQARRPTCVQSSIQHADVAAHGDGLQNTPLDHLLRPSGTHGTCVQ